MEAFERSLILRALERTGDNRTEAARLLGISFRSMRYRLSKLGIAAPADAAEREGDPAPTPGEPGEPKLGAAARGPGAPEGAS